MKSVCIVLALTTTNAFVTPNRALPAGACRAPAAAPLSMRLGAQTARRCTFAATDACGQRA